MKPKTTLNLFKSFLGINFKKYVLSFLTIALKKASLSHSSLTYIFVALLLLSASIAFSKSSSCPAKLTSDHFPKAGSDFLTKSYFQTVTNTVSLAKALSLSFSNITSSCSNIDGNDNTYK
jgi:hypothetical protein